MALLATFAHAALSYWTSVFPLVGLHMARWRRRARRIPDPVLRRLALEALAKRSNIEGAAVFAAFAPLRRRAEVTRASSAFQAAYNLLDMLGEQPSPDPVRDGRRLHEALVYAVTPRGASAPLDCELGRQSPGTALDWYEHHPQRNDGGYLDSLLEECRDAFAKLPSQLVAAPAAQAAAARIVAFQSLNLSKSQGEHAGLERWARAATPPETGLQWWETAAAAGSSLGVYTSIAAAAEPRLDADEVSALARAYFPWIGGLHSLLDNLIDKHEDEAAGHRSLIEYYDPEQAARRMRWMAERAFGVASELPHSRRHVVVLAAMIGNYLAAPEAQSAELRPIGGRVLATMGALQRPTMLVFELRRLSARIRHRPRERGGTTAKGRAGGQTGQASATMGQASGQTGQADATAGRANATAGQADATGGRADATSEQAEATSEQAEATSEQAGTTSGQADATSGPTGTTGERAEATPKGETDDTVRINPGVDLFR